MKGTLYRYIFQEVWPGFMATLLLSIFIVLATEMLKITEMVVSQGVKIRQVLGMVVFLMPDIVVFALPAAALISVVVAFLRLSADNEIIAMKSCGISLYQMLPPVILLSVAGCAASLGIATAAVPWGNSSFKSLIFEIAESKADLGIKERVFSEPFDGVTFYVNDYSPESRMMEEVFVVDRREKGITNTIFAERAMVVKQPEQKTISLHFENGTILVSEKDLQAARTIAFESYNLSIGLKDIMAALSSRKRDPKEMSIGELLERSEETSKETVRYNEMRIELWERFAIPIAVLLMGLIGVPLGAQLKASGRSAGVAVSLVIFMIYYMCLAGAKSICEAGALSPEIGVWIPDLFLLACFIFLFRRAAGERSIALLPRRFRRSRGTA